MKIVRVVLFLLGLGICALTGKVLMGVGNVSAALGDAVVLESPIVLPENEGKIVILYGKPEMTAPAYDEELGLTLQTVKALRYKEAYEWTLGEKEEYAYKWVSKGMETLVGEAKIGEFVLSNETLIALPAESHYEDFDAQEASRYSLDKPSLGSADLYVLPLGSYYYAESNHRRSYEYAGTEAYRYRFFDAERYATMTFVGRQLGNTLVDSGVDGITRVYTDKKTRDEVVSSNKTALLVGSGVGMLLGAALVLLAVRKGKNTVPNQKRKKG